MVHPFDAPVEVPQSIASALHKAATMGPSAIKEVRAKTLQWYADLAESLCLKEKDLHTRLHADVELIVKDKKFLLFRQMLKDIGYDDMDVVYLLFTGVKLFGELPVFPFWEHDASKSSHVTQEQLWSGARAAQASVSIAGKIESGSQDELWDITMEEVIAQNEFGSLIGPLTASELKEAVGPLWIAARRFAVEQNGKIRPIDHFSEFNVNAAFGACQKLA